MVIFGLGEFSAKLPFNISDILLAYHFRISKESVNDCVVECRPAIFLEKDMKIGIFFINFT